MRWAAVGLVAAVALVAPVSGASASALSDPAANRQPSNAFVAACHNMSATKAANDQCIAAASSDFSAAWVAEGVSATFALPSDFDTLAAPYQLLAISNVERVARGLAPVQGLTAYLDSLAQQGADADGDPPFPSPFSNYGTSGAGNWAGAGRSALLDDFYWMYDDGLGSFNGDCYQGHTSGCWGHRRNILMNGSSPLVMGAASATDATYGASMAEEFIGGYKKLATDPVLSPSWAEIAATMPNAPGDTTVTLSTHSVSVTADTDALGHATVTVTAPVDGAAITDKITAGSGQWSVSPASCDLGPSESCVLHLRFEAPEPGTAYPGTLTVTDSIGSDEVSLTGTQAEPVAKIAANKTSIAKGKTVKLTGKVRSGKKHLPLAGKSVVLQAKRAGGTWSALARKVSDASGQAVFARHPQHTAKYRVQVRSGGTFEATSTAVKVEVR